MAADRWVKGDELKDPCRLCGGVLVVRENTRTKNLFVGCMSFPSCKMNRPLRVGDQRKTSDQESPANAADEQDRDPTGALCSVCEKPQFRSPGGVTCENGHGGAAGVDPTTGEVTYADDEPDPFAKYGGEPGVLVEGSNAMAEAMHKATGGSTPDPSLLISVQKMPDKGDQAITSIPDPDLSDVFEQDCGYRLHVQVTLEPVDQDLDVRRADMDVDGIPMDLDRARMRRDAGHDVALEVTGRLLPRIVETLGRVMW